MTRKFSKTTKTEHRGPGRAQVVVSMGCPSGVGPELIAEVCQRGRVPRLVIVGDRGALRAGARARGQDPTWVDGLSAFEPGSRARLQLVQVGESLRAADRVPGRPTPLGGQHQLLYIERAYQVAHDCKLPLSTLPVSKEVIAQSGLERARRFLGHTEWLESLDSAPYSVMCFAAKALITSLVTTHVPLARVPRLLSPELVRRAIVEVAELASALSRGRHVSTHPLRIAVCSLNPHAGEGELLGREEITAIQPGIELARGELGRSASVLGPVGAETALRKGNAGVFDAVVAMYHDQATIPMKLIDFGGSVNVTQGLSIVRTSVDHGTAYDIAGRGTADARGLRSALQVAVELEAARHEYSSRA